jgi:hypothetical protein
MKKLKVSPSSLKAFLACRRRWYLEYVQRADRIVPSYVTNGSTLDAVVQDYLNGKTPVLAAGSPELAELNSLLGELPAPRSVMVQHRFELPCPGLEDSVLITTGGLDYMTPPNLDLMVVGDLKRIWHKDAAMTEAQLADDVQAQIYAWFVWQVYNPAEVVWRWTYCVRETRNGTTGAVTRKAKAFSVDVKADRARVESWFERVVVPAARAMLELKGPTEQVEHNPDSCEEGARCFVRHHCPLYSGPVRGDNNMVDLSRFRTSARPAINPPAPDGPGASALALVSDITKTRLDGLSKELQQLSVLPTDAPVLEVQTVEGDAASLAALGLEVVADEPETRETEPAPAPAPAPEASLVPAPSRKRRRAEKQEPRLDAHEAEVINPPTLEGATTEAIMHELRDRGWHCTLVDRSGL